MISALLSVCPWFVSQLPKVYNHCMLHGQPENSGLQSQGSCPGCPVHAWSMQCKDCTACSIGSCVKQVMLVPWQSAVRNAKQTGKAVISNFVMQRLDVQSFTTCATGTCSLHLCQMPYQWWGIWLDVWAIQVIRGLIKTSMQSMCSMSAVYVWISGHHVISCMYVICNTYQWRLLRTSSRFYFYSQFCNVPPPPLPKINMIINFLHYVCWCWHPC